MTTKQTKTRSPCINVTQLMERGAKRRSGNVETTMINAQQQQDDTSIDSGMDNETNAETNTSTTNASINASTSAATINHYDLPALNRHSIRPRLIIEPFESSTINHQKYLRLIQCTLTDISIEASLATRKGYIDIQIIRIISNGRSSQQNQ